MLPVEIENRRRDLAALKIYPRDQAPNAAALARALRAFELFTGDKRQLIGKLIRDFEVVLERQDPREADVARKQLHERLDQLEGERFL